MPRLGQRQGYRRRFGRGRFVLAGLVALLLLLAGLALFGGAGDALAQSTTDYDLDNNDLIDVSTPAQLDAIRHDLDGDGSPTAGGTTAYNAAFSNAVTGMGCPNTCIGYELKADLDFDTDNSGTANSGDTYWNNGLGWEPLGNNATKFTATFDGNSGTYTISNLHINRPAGDRMGLFGRTTGATLRNIALEDVSIIAARRTGALVGHADAGTISNSSSKGGTVTVSGDRAGGLVGQVNGAGTISGSYSTVNVVSNGGEAGGLVALMLGQGAGAVGSVSSSYATGTVSGTTNVGGLVGRVSLGNVADSHATGAVGSTAANAKVGGLVGWFHGEVSGTTAVQVTANLSASYATGDVTVSGAGVHAGGLVGESRAFIGTDTHDANRATVNIRASYATGAVGGSGATNRLGGLVGYNDSDRTPGPSGVRGQTNSNIIASYATGAVTGASGATIGGLVGETRARHVAVQVGSSNTTITDSYWDVTASSVADDADSPVGEGKTTTELQTPIAYGTGAAIYADWNLNLDGTAGGDDPWDFGTNSQYPVLKYNRDAAAISQQRPAIVVPTTTDYDTNDNNLIDIINLAQFNAIRHDPDGNGDATHADYAAAFPNRVTTATGRMGCPDACTGYELRADLDFDTDDDDDVDSNDDYPNWTPIPGYASTFQGNGHIIDKLTINDTASGLSHRNIGLFDYIADNARISGVGLPNANVRSTYSGSLGMGALAGHVNRSGTAVTSSWATGSVTATDTGSSTKYIGGLLGNVDGAVRASYSGATVTADNAASGVLAGSLAGRVGNGSVTASYATGAVSGGAGSTSHVGGLVGQVSNGTVTASYATGAVTGGATTANVGGLAGSGASRVTNSYWDTTTSSITGTGAGTGKTTAELQTPTAYGTATSTPPSIYASWNVDVDADASTGDSSGNDDPWDFGTNSQYPVLKYNYDADAITRQRPAIVVPTNRRLRWQRQQPHRHHQPGPA